MNRLTGNNRLVYNLASGSSVDLIKSKQQLDDECLVRDKDYLEDSFQQTIAHLETVKNERDKAKTRVILANHDKERMKHRLRTVIAGLRAECDTQKKELKDYKDQLKLAQNEVKRLENQKPKNVNRSHTLGEDKPTAHVRPLHRRSVSEGSRPSEPVYENLRYIQAIIRQRMDRRREAETLGPLSSQDPRQGPPNGRERRNDFGHFSETIPSLPEPPTQFLLDSQENFRSQSVSFFPRISRLPPLIRTVPVSQQSAPELDPQQSIQVPQQSVLDDHDPQHLPNALITVLGHSIEESPSSDTMMEQSQGFHEDIDNEDTFPSGVRIARRRSSPDILQHLQEANCEDFLESRARQGSDSEREFGAFGENIRQNGTESFVKYLYANPFPSTDPTYSPGSIGRSETRSSILTNQEQVLHQTTSAGTTGGYRHRNPIAKVPVGSPVLERRSQEVSDDTDESTSSGVLFGAVNPRLRRHGISLSHFSQKSCGDLNTLRLTNV